MQPKQTQTIPTFIRTILSMIQKDPSVVNWTEDGTQFSILNTKRFTLETLPLFFKHQKFESFVRQLNMYGFHKVCRDKNSINFKNQFFIRDGQEKYWMIKRKKKQIAELKVERLGRQQRLKELVTKKYSCESPALSQFFEELLQFKVNYAENLYHLKKNLDQLGREINERKSKAIKPLLGKAKEVISQTMQYFREVNSQFQTLENQIQQQFNHEVSTNIKIVPNQITLNNYDSFTNLLDLKPFTQVPQQKKIKIEYTNIPGLSSYSSFDLLN